MHTKLNMLSFPSRTLFAAVAVLVSAGFVAEPLGAQASAPPAGWQKRFDKGEHAGHGADSLVFTTMTPGFHVTTGPAVLLWHPDSVSRGDGTVDATLHLFDTKGRNREGYGIFIGGRELSAAAQSYTYFLLRNDGRFIIKQRAGEDTPTLVPWTEHGAIKVWTAASGPSQRNDLSVQVAGADVKFMVNGQVVHTLPKAQVNPDGVFGVRVNHSVDMHVESVSRAK